MVDSDRCNRMFWPVIAAIYQGTAWLGACVFLMWYVPRYEKIYRDFKAELPAAAKFVILFTHFLYDWWFTCFVPIAVCAGVVFAVGVLLERTRSGFLKFAWYFLTALLPIAILLLAVVAIVLPLATLINHLSQ